MIKEETSKKKRLFVAILLTLAMVLYAQFILGHFSTCFFVEGGPNSLGLLVGYSVTDVFNFLEIRTEEQLRCYVDFLKIWDTLFPMLYTAMHVSWLMFLFRKWFYPAFIPFLHMVADWGENYIEISFVHHYLDMGRLPEAFVSAGSFITITKWVLSLLTYVIIIYGIINKLRDYRTTPKPH